MVVKFKQNNTMKKTVLILFCVAASVAAQAQFTLGAGFSANGLLGRENNSYGVDLDNQYSLTPSLRMGYRWASGLSAGMEGSLTYVCGSTEVSYNEPYPTLYQSGDRCTTTEVLSWQGGAWVRYDLPLGGRLSLFANLGVGAGSMYSRTVREYTHFDELTGERETVRTEYNEFGNRNSQLRTFDLRLTPGVACRLGSHWTAELWLDMLQIGYSHFMQSEKESTVAEPADKANDISTTHAGIFFFGSRAMEQLHSLLLTERFLAMVGAPGGTFHLGCTYTF